MEGVGTNKLISLSNRTSVIFCKLAVLVVLQSLLCNAESKQPMMNVFEDQGDPVSLSDSQPLQVMDLHLRHRRTLLDNESNANWSESQVLSTAPPSQTPEHRETLDTLEFWIEAVLTNIVVILGLIGNSLTIIILTRRAMRSSTNVYLTALAIWDAVVLICTALLIGWVRFGISFYNNYVHAYIVCYVYPVALIAQTATIWLTVSFTVERFIAVSYPLKAARMCTLKRAKIVILGVSIGATLYNIPRWFEYRPDLSSPTKVDIGPGPLQSKTIYTQVYFSWLYVPIMCIIPLATLSVLNTCLVLAVRRSQKHRKEMNVRQSRENNVTIMLAAVVIVFIVCQVPALVYNLAFAIDKHYVERVSFGYQVLSIIRNLLVTFNSSINFLLYCALGQKFRRIFIHTFCKRCVNDTYMPMSGIHQHTTMVTMASQKAGPRQYYANNHHILAVRNKAISEGTTSSSNTTQTTGGTSTSQESALIDCNPTPYTNPNREVCTYMTSAGNKKVSSPGHFGDSDTEGYDIALEQLLTSSEKSESNLTAGYQPSSSKKNLYGIKNNVAVQ